MAARKKSQKGNPRANGSGRKKGTPNKRTQKLLDQLEGLELDPVAESVEIYRMALSAWKHDQSDFAYRYLEIASRKLECLMEYCYPKRKAIEFPPDEETGMSLIDIVKAAAGKK